MDLYPEDRAKIDAGNLMRPVLGGSSGNIAAGLARLGGDAEMLSLVSEDPVGDFVRAQCRKYGIGTRHLGIAPKGTRTSLALAENRLRDYEVVIYRNNAADLALDTRHIDAVDFRQFNALVVTATALSADPSRTATLEAMNRAGVSVLDLDYRKEAWESGTQSRSVYREAVELADILVGNDAEFALVGDERAARALGKKRTVVYKMAEEGARIFAPGQCFSVPAFKVDALKPVGAGDAFLSAFLMALAEGRELKRAVREGSAHAAIVVSRAGCASAMATREELDDFLRERN